MTEDKTNETKITDFLPTKNKEVDYRDIKIHVDMTPQVSEEDYPETNIQNNFSNISGFGTICEELPPNSEFIGLTLKNSTALSNSEPYQSSEVYETLRDHDSRLENLESIVSQNVMLKVEGEQKDREIATLKRQIAYLRGMVLQWDKRISSTTQEIHTNLEQKMPIVNYVYNYLKVVEAQRTNNQDSTTDKNDPKNDRIIF